MSVPDARVIGSSKTVLPLGSPRSRGNTAATSVPARLHAASPWQRRATPSWGPCVAWPCIASRASSGSPRRPGSPGSGSEPKTMMRSQNPQDDLSSCHAMRWGIPSEKSGASWGSGKRSIATPGSGSTGHVGDGTRRR